MRMVMAAVAASLFCVQAMAADIGAVRAACKADVTALCQGIQPGGGRIKECLKANKDKLSEGCKSAIATMIEARKAERNASPAPQATSQTPQ